MDHTLEVHLLAGNAICSSSYSIGVGLVSMILKPPAALSFQGLKNSPFHSLPFLYLQNRMGVTGPALFFVVWWLVGLFVEPGSESLSGLRI